MDDTFRPDLEGYDKEYVQEVLNEFFEDSHRYGRRLIEIRMSKSMLDKLGIDNANSFFRRAPIIVGDTGFEGTIEVVLAPQH